VWQAIKFSGGTFVFNMETHEWDQLKCRGHRVPERDFHTATAVIGRNGRKIVVFGGRSTLKGVGSGLVVGTD